MGASPLISAPGVAVLINGKPYGLVYEISFNSNTPRKRVKSIDILQALELIPLDVEISCSMGIYRLRGGGGIEGPGMTAPVPDISRENYFSVTLVDLATKFIIFQATQCSIESQSWSVGVKQFLVGRISWSTLSWSNEVVSLSS